MPRHDCFEIDYSLGDLPCFPMGSRWVGMKTKKKSGAWTNSCQEQFPITTSRWRLFSLFPSFFFFFPQMAFQPSLEVKIRSRVRGPSQILLIAVSLSSCPSLTPWMKKSALGFFHSAYCLGFNRIPLCWLYFVLFLPLNNIGLYAQILVCRSQSVSTCLMWGISGTLYIRSRQCWCEILVQILMLTLLGSCVCKLWNLCFKH